MKAHRGQGWTLIEGDCVRAMKALPADRFEAVVCDPPYGLEFMGKEWDGADGFRRSLNEADVGRDSAFGRLSARGPEYRGGTVFQQWCEAWACAALRVLKPGGYLLAFGGSRTFHRLACAIEDAGFEVRDTLSWLYGSGMPKNAQTQLKPAWEPIILARKPLAGTVAANVLAHGTGALNIDACRIGDRWPANVLLDESAAALLDAQAPNVGAAAPVKGTEPSAAVKNALNPRARVPGAFHGDRGGASRFFYCAKASRSDRGEGNTHPTVKPVALMRWLVRLVTPPGGTVLDPFTGSGSTGVAALHEGFSFVGVEQSAEYAAIAAGRLASVQIPDSEEAA